MVEDHYAILEITENASEEVIKAAYKALVKKYHPDNNPDENIDEKMKKINNAYEILSDPDKRAEYDSKYKKNNTGNKDKSAQHYYYAPSQPKRPIMRMEPMDPDRLSVQGLTYCGGILQESDEVSVYMNFRHQLNVCKSDMKSKVENLNFSVDMHNIKTFEAFQDAFLNYITDAFYIACSQMGMYKEEIDTVYGDILDDLTNSLAHYLREFEELLQSSKVPYKRRVKEFIEKYKESIGGILDSYTNAFERYFISAVNKVCTSYEMGLYVEDINSNDKIDVHDLPEDETERFSFLMRLVSNCPYWKPIYRFLLKKYGDRDGHLQTFAAAYGLNLVEMKKEMLSNFIKSANLNEQRYIHRFKERMDFLSYPSEYHYRELCERYAQAIITRLYDFSPNNVNSIVKQLDEFDKEFGYNSAEERKSIQDRLLSNFGINPKIHDKEQCERNLQEIKKLDGEYNIDFSKSVDLIKRNLEEIRLEEEKIQMKKEEEERQRDIENRTVGLIDRYNFREKSFKKRNRLFETAEEAELFKTATEEIGEICKEFSLTMDEEEWAAQMKLLTKACNNYHYPNQRLLDGLRKDYREEDRKKRTFANHEYPTREAAEQAKKESEIIEQIDKSTYNASVERLRKYKQENFQSKYAKDKIAALEAQIIRDYNNREADMRKHRQSAAAAVPKAIIGVVAVIATVAFVILGIICFFAVSRLLGIGLFVLAFVVYQKKDTMSTHHVYRKPEDFDGITVVDGKIIWTYEDGQAVKKSASSKNTQPVREKKTDSKSVQICSVCGTQVKENAKFCMKCGAKIQ